MHGMMGPPSRIHYGFIRGFQKGHRHLKAERDRDIFASILEDVHSIVSPGVTILGGIIGMCGDGPSSGTPTHCGTIAISKNTFALDNFIERRLCPQSLHPMTQIANRHQLVGEYEVIDRNAAIMRYGLEPAIQR